MLILPLCISFRINFLISTKYLAGILVGIVFYLQIKQGKTDFLTVLNLLIHKDFFHVTSFQLFSLWYLLSLICSFPHGNCQFFSKKFYSFKKFFCPCDHQQPCKKKPTHSPCERLGKYFEVAGLGGPLLLSDLVFHSVGLLN